MVQGTSTNSKFDVKNPQVSYFANPRQWHTIVRQAISYTSPFTGQTWFTCKKTAGTLSLAQSPVIQSLLLIMLFVRLIVLSLSISTFRNVDDTNLEQTIHLAAGSSPCRPARCTCQAWGLIPAASTTQRPDCTSVRQTGTTLRRCDTVRRRAQTEVPNDISRRCKFPRSSTAALSRFRWSVSRCYVTRQNYDIKFKRKFNK